ncbi:helix-turn-helix transcriptional regulator [Aquabacterium sp. J223]|uniref:helix-turn-helix transcriptional regulator n=1 Tax=Aquabacterium sp. J223 TaxID=2898431 RepID=UPI0021AD774B|nr:helix-turn-helix transcriptional regulator [Aquabacterium sp. J223]UUX97702.1 helix-turn-helix transcriptional regulator [Aquabacterium sp. J223]
MTLEHLHLMLTGTSLGLSLGILMTVVRDRQLPTRVRGLVAALAFGGAAYSLTTADAWAGWGGGVRIGLRWAAMLGMVALWQLVRVLFNDERGWRTPAIAAAVASAAVLANPLWLKRPGGMALGVTVVAGALALHTFWMLLRGRAGDLDEGRRRLRLWWVVVAGLYVVAVLIVHNLPWDGAGTAAHGVAQVSGQIAIKVAWLTMASGHPSPLAMLSLSPRSAVSVAGVAHRGDLLATVRPATAGDADAEPAAAGTPSQALRRRQAELICAAMTGEHLYRRTRLSVADVAGHLRMPQARLRLVIHEQLGFRHFNAFVNQFRLAEVASRLRDPRDAHLPILTLALEAGFGSIGPFNRAFREAYGVTPTEFRRGDDPPGGERLAETSNLLAKRSAAP